MTRTYEIRQWDSEGRVLATIEAPTAIEAATAYAQDYYVDDGAIAGWAFGTGYWIGAGREARIEQKTHFVGVREAV